MTDRTAALAAHDVADAAYRAAWTAEQAAILELRSTGRHAALETARKATNAALDILDEATDTLAPFMREDEDIDAFRARIAEAANLAEGGQLDLFGEPEAPAAEPAPVLRACLCGERAFTRGCECVRPPMPAEAVDASRDVVDSGMGPRRYRTAARFPDDRTANAFLLAEAGDRYGVLHCDTRSGSVVVAHIFDFGERASAAA